MVPDDTDAHEKEWNEERSIMADSIQSAINNMPDRNGEMVSEFLVIAVMFTKDGEKLISTWTPPDQRAWTTMGLMQFVQSDHDAYMAERRLGDHD